MKLPKSAIEALVIIIVIIHPIILEKAAFDYLPMIFLLFAINITKTIIGGAAIPLLITLQYSMVKGLIGRKFMIIPINVDATIIP
jgi:hypothetical protein